MNVQFGPSTRENRLEVSALL